MKKSVAVAAVVTTAAVAMLGELAIHGYLDIMYKETIQPSLIKRLANKNGTAGMDEFASFTEESCRWISEQKIEVIDRKNIYGYNLKGYYLPADQKSKCFVVFAHGYRADHLGDPANFERYYHEKGFNFLSVDHTAAGDSEGDFVGFDYFESNDLLDWVYYLINRFGSDISIVLHGVSMGGATVCKMASRVPQQVKLIISDCAYTSANDQFAKVAADVGVKRLTPAILAAMNLLNKRLAHYDLKQTDVRQSVINSKAPMLFVHGSADDFVPVDMCYELYDLCTNDKDILIIDNAYHAQSIMTDGKKYKSKIDEVIEKYGIN